MEQFKSRHIGINESDKQKMLEAIGLNSIDELINQTIPEGILMDKDLELPEALSEKAYAEKIAQIASKNEVFASYIGMAGTILLHLQQFIGMFLRIRCGILHILHIKLKFRKEDWKLCLIFRPSLVS